LPDGGSTYQYIDRQQYEDCLADRLRLVLACLIALCVVSHLAPFNRGWVAIVVMLFFYW